MLSNQGDQKNSMTESSNWGCIKSLQGVTLANISKDYFTFGSGPENDIIITSVNATKTHFAISKDPDGNAWISDLSGISTFVNGKSIKDDVIELKANDLIYVTGNESDHAPSLPIWMARFHIDTEKTSKRSCSPEPSTSLDAKRPCLKKETSLGLEDLLTCSICCEIMYECQSVQPCLHNFCKVCLLDWLTRDKICPSCRGDVKGIGNNFQLSNIIEKYLVHHPDSKKTDDQEKEIHSRIAELEKKVLPLSNTDLVNPPRFTNPVQHNNHVFLCEWCNNSVSVLNQICTGHTKCSCCNLNMPTSVAATAANLSDPSCPLCHRMFCGFIRIAPDTCRCRGSRCVGSLEDLRQESSIWLPPPLLNNVVESNFVKEYLELKEIGVDAFLDDLFTRLNRISIHLIDDGLNRPALANVTTNTRMCASCRRSCLNRLLLDWRCSLTEDEEKNSWPERSNCYYGVNCRTQRSNLDHARRFNHCCPQTRFN